MAAAVALLLLAQVGVANASHSTTDTFSTNWYSLTSTVNGTVGFHVAGSNPSPFMNPGTPEERLVAVNCSGEGVTQGTGFLDDPWPTSSSTVRVSVTVAGDAPNPSGVLVVCTSTYERRDGLCFVIFGCTGGWVEGPGPTWFKTIRIDASPPVVTPSLQGGVVSSFGWYRELGTVVFSGVDPNSGIVGCTPPQPMNSADGNRLASGNCTNGAGRSTNASIQYRVDRTPPVLNPTVNPSTVAIGGSAVASPNASDALSGIDTASCNDGEPLPTDEPGTQSVTCTATDKAGNVTTAQASYQVGYGFSGLDAPVDADAVNVAKAGRTIPLKFRVTDVEGAGITTLTSVGVRADDTACDLGATPDDIEQYAGTSGLQHLGDGYYQYNWATPKSYANSCKTLVLDLGDGIEHTAAFRFTR